MIDKDAYFKWVYNLSEATVCMIGDPELIALWEDAHERKIQKAKGYQAERFSREEKINKGMINPIEKKEIMRSKDKHRAKKNFKKQPTFLGVHDNKADVENTAGRAASLRQNIKQFKFDAKGSNTPKQRYTVYGTGNKNNPYTLHAMHNKRSTKLDNALDLEEENDEKKERNKFSKGLNGGAQPLRRSYFLTPNGGEDTRKHEITHIQDFDDTKKMHGEKAAMRLLDDAKKRNKKNNKAYENFENVKNSSGVDKDRTPGSFSKRELINLKTANPALRKAVIQSKKLSMII